MMQGASKEVERYQKVSVLGEGAMGKAYLVKSSQDGCEYVMKRINIGHLPAKEKENALREAQLHSLLQHPNIVQFRELYQTTGDKLCIIMQYAEGSWPATQGETQKNLSRIRMERLYHSLQYFQFFHRSAQAFQKFTLSKNRNRQKDNPSRSKDSQHLFGKR